jgi:small subunit ribosomal protein S20
MPTSKQAKKRMVQSERKRVANKASRSAMKTAIKKVFDAGSKADAEKLLPAAVQKVDKAAKDRVIHPNAAARKKSQLARAVGKK